MGIFSSPQQAYAPPVPALPPAAATPPTPVSPDAVQAATNSKAALASAGGYSSTIATGGQGVTTPTTVAPKTLLGM